MSRDLDPELLDRIVCLVQQAESYLGSTRLIAIDGPAGSGKTTLASQLDGCLKGCGLKVATLHLDDLYEGWTGLTRGLETRLLEQVIRPLATGQPARWQRYDWHTGAFTEWTELPSPDVLVLEGCGSGALAYASYTSLLVWVEAKEKERIERGVRRDGPGVLPQWLAWMEQEAAHFATNRTRERAQVHLST